MTTTRARTMLIAAVAGVALGLPLHAGLAKPAKTTTTGTTAAGPTSAPATTGSTATPAAASSAAAGAAVFPSAVSTKYASQKPGDARMHTCLDQYHTNKAGTGNGGMKWIQKGGGYYSMCSKKLKGSA